MCGIAGVIHKGAQANVGEELTAMLQSMKHRGPDSTGFALYHQDATDNQYIMRLKVAEQEDLRSGFDIHETISQRKADVDARLRELGAEVLSTEDSTEYAQRYLFNFNGELKRLIDYIEDLDSVEILSIGKALELVKDLGDATAVATQYGIGSFRGSHAIGHARMATESDVDISSAHPYWAYPFSDVSVVHNGQLTNYWTMRRALERRGHRFMSNCDSELIAVYIADRIHEGSSLEDSMKKSIDELDGVFTYVIATRDALGMAKDVMAAKPMVLYESDDLIALASEEVAIRSIFPHEIDTYDPYDGEVRVWQT
jgi:glutamate synthase domain-containing protein 1